MVNQHIELLRSRVDLLESQLYELKKQLSEAERDAERLANESCAVPTVPSAEPVQGVKAATTGNTPKWPLDADDYVRYGRQMIMPEIGLQGGNYAAYADAMKALNANI